MTQDVRVEVTVSVEVTPYTLGSRVSKLTQHCIVREAGSNIRVG